MEGTDVKTLDDLRQMEAALADALVGKSKDFFLPESIGVYWEVERKPYTPEVLVLRPNKPVNRAWHFVFGVLLSRIAPLG